MKIGFIGGTFDPIHNGHIDIAKQAYNELKLDKVLFIPTGNSYFKTDVSDAIDRYIMAQKAVSGYSWAIVDDCEIKRGGKTYTADTIRYLKEKYFNCEIYLIIGSDTLFMIEQWHEFEYVLSNVNIVVCCRNNPDNGEHTLKQYSNHSKSFYSIEEYIAYINKIYLTNIYMLNMNPIDLSSSDIRNDILENYYMQGIRENIYNIPNDVFEYIIDKGLYKNA